MRVLVIVALLATAATSPALGQQGPRDRRAEREAAWAQREQQQEARAQRQEALEERSEQFVEPGAEPREREPAVRERERPNRRSLEWGPTELPTVHRDRPSLEQRRERSDSVAGWRQEQREQIRQSRPGRIADGVSRPRVSPPADARPDIPAPAIRTSSRHNRIQWASNWHRDRRHDWRDHRRRHGSLFRLGFYFDPFGWNYQRYGRGWRLWPNYYERSRWLDDPMMYRLPYAPHPYRWIRYWDDALLVDTYSGEVVDVVHDFFW